MKAWSRYAGATAVLGAGLGALVAWVVPGRDAGSVWVAAGVAWAAQLVAFGALVRVRHRPESFIGGWVGGIAVRAVAVVGLAIAVSRSEALVAEPALMAAVGFLFVMTLLEPIFLRIAE